MINFPNNPIDDDTYIDNNNRLWIFNNGYWQERVPPSNIDLLRDVKIVDTTQVDSVLYWNEFNNLWETILLTYSTDDIPEFNFTSLSINDVMKWSGTEYINRPETDYIQHKNTYNLSYLSEIETSGYMSVSTYGSWVKQTFDTIVNSTDTNMVDLQNNRLVCTSTGIYKIVFFNKLKHIDADLSRYQYGYSIMCRVYSPSGDVKYRYFSQENRTGGQYNYEFPQYGTKSFIDTVNLDVGDYMEFEFQKELILFSEVSTSHHYGRMSMFKISDLQPSETFDRIVDVDATTPVPVEISLDAGTYEIRPKRRKYTAINRWNVEPYGCDASGDNCVLGWKFELSYSSSEIITSSMTGSNGWQSTADQALTEILKYDYPEFTITYTQTLSFWFDDSVYTDNQGGVSFELWKIV